MSRSKNTLPLAARLGFASLLTGLAAHLARADLITFQNGVNGYAGAFDRRISLSGTSDTNGADVNTDTRSYFIDGGGSALNDSGVSQGLLRFDNIVGAGAIPANALIISATLDTVTTTFSNSQGGSGAYNVYRLTTPFDGTSTYQTPFGGDGVYGDVARFGGSFNRPALGAPSSARVDRIVQDWVNGTTNYGFAIRSDQTTDGWSFNTTGAATVANRPKLTVNYTTDPSARLLRYQQNVDGYTGTTDLFVNGTSGSNVGTPVPGAAIEQGFLDGSNRGAATENSYDQPYFVKFDNLDLSAPKVTRAQLIIRSGFGSSNSGSGGPFSVHRILKPWDTGTTYDSLDSDGDPTLTPVAELVANGFIAPESAEATQIGHAGMVTLDVTDIVQTWKDGAPNYGFYIGPNGGTSDGWQIFTSGAYGFGTLDEVSGQLAPELTILYAPDSAVPEPATLGLAAVAGTLLAGRRRNRRR
jgi:hypothetical protein